LRLLWRSQIRTPYTPTTIYSDTLLICVKTYAWKASSWKGICRSSILTPYISAPIFLQPTDMCEDVRAEGAHLERSTVESYSHTLHACLLYSPALLIQYVPKALRQKALWGRHIVTPHTSATLFSHRTDLCPYTFAEGAQLERTAYCVWSAIQS